MESNRKRLDFLRGVDKADDNPRKAAMKDYKAKEKVADKAHLQALASGKPEDHVAAVAASQTAHDAAQKTYNTGSGSRASNEALHAAKQVYRSRTDLHAAAAKGDRGAEAGLHQSAATFSKYGTGPERNPAAEAHHAAEAVNAHLDAADKAKAEAAEHRAEAEKINPPGAHNSLFSSEANRALQHENAARQASEKAKHHQSTADRLVKDHAAALAGAGLQRDEHGRFAGKG